MNTNKQKIKRKLRTRAKVQGTSSMPRLSVFRSNKFVYAQLIDDSKGKTIIGISPKHITAKEKGNKTNQGKLIGQLIAKKAQSLKIKKVVFDRGHSKYHGIVKAIAESAREGGLLF